MSTGKGYLLPAEIVHDLICVTLKIPNAPEYRAAFRGQLKGLTEWWNWERRADKGNIAAADYWRQIINEHLIIQDCYELDFLGCDDMAQFEMCWFDTEGGRVLRYTLNGGCTWVDVGSCNGGSVTVPPGEIIIVDPVDPINNDGNVPTPEYSEDARCFAAEFGFYDMLGTDSFGAPRLFQLIADVILGTDAAVSSNLLNWLSNSALLAGGGSYIEYFELFKALILKWKPHAVAIENTLEAATFADAICHIYNCITPDVNVTRETLDCVADYFQSMADANADGSDAEKYFEFIVDFIKIYPVKWIRHHVLRRVGLGGELIYCPCTDPEPGVCEYLAYIWANHALEETLGWVSITGGNPKEWAYSVCDFFAAEIMYPMSKISSLNGGGWHLTQEAPPNSRRAGFIQRIFDEPIALCDLYVNFFTKTNQNNTRMSVAWTRTDGVWTPLVANRKNINVAGDINLFWQGESRTIDALLIGGWVGYNQVGSNLTIGNIYLNNQLA